MPTIAQRRRRAGTVRQDASSPKTTRPLASQRREAGAQIGNGAPVHRRKFDAFPDRVDIRDWIYQPHLGSLPDQLINCDSVPIILDQGREGACTGFALAAVINYQLYRRNLRRSVSPRMLYDMARRYDEWPGEAYDGSSARGAMKGWVAHGVCAHDAWKDDLHGAENLTPEIAAAARGTPGGAYYRVAHKQIRDMHAALAESGILYATLMVHEGWFQPGADGIDISYVENGNLRTRPFPIIKRKGRADNGHAIAIVGYTSEGFIVQNSWGPGWGAGGFALLPYEDYLLHSTDVWVAQLGVPIRIDLWDRDVATRDTSSGLHRAAASIPLSEIRPFVVDVGNNGELSDSGDYWTTEDDLSRLFAKEIPNATQNWSKRRVLLYLHGGLNDEKAVAQRIVSYRDVLLDNEIYPLHIMWESGVMDALKNLIRDLFTDADDRAGAVSDWLNRFREGLLEAKDRTLELTAALPGSALWSEMKENARLASKHPRRQGGMQLLAKHAKSALQKLAPADRAAWEIHVVGHSAGAIFGAHALEHLLDVGVPLKTLQFMAPAITVEQFKQLVVKFVGHGCPHPTMYILSGVGERDDDVGPYGKSLLYLVSNAFEGSRNTSILGMERFISDADGAPPDDVDPQMKAFFNRQVNGLPSLIVAGKNYGNLASVSRSDTHGGFDNDPETMNSVLWRILGAKPDRLFTLRDLQFEGAGLSLEPERSQSRGRQGASPIQPAW